jgi:hypothetical protein
LKLPKGIKRMRVSASEDDLKEALDLASSGGFNGFIRTTAPKGIKEAGVILFLEGRARIAVFQSPERSLYGPDALIEVRRVAGNKAATIRVEEFLAQNLDDVQNIVAKMKKARIEAPDIERNIMGIDIETDIDVPPPKAKKETNKEMEVSQNVTTEKKDVGKVRAKTADRITRSKEAAGKGDNDILKMLQDVGMSPEDEDSLDDDVNQYIAAFEDFLTRDKDEEGRVTAEPVDVTIAVDNILDEMLEAADDDPALMEFIENQRERILTKASEKADISPEEKHDRLSEQQTALEHISTTFRDVLIASEKEALKRKNKLAEMRDKGLEEEDWLDGEANALEEEAERASSLETILDQVMETHRERLEGAEDFLDGELDDEELEEEEPPKELDLEDVKKDFLNEMRTRIHTVADNNGIEPEPGKVSDAVEAVSDDIHEKVEELEHEKAALTQDRKMLEERADELEDRLETMEVDMEVEVQARLRELEAKETGLRNKSKEYQDLEGHLEDERKKVEKDLERARAEEERIAEMERQLKDREKLLSSREVDLEGKEQEVDGLREHLEQEITQRADELEAIEARLKEHEKELIAKEKELTAAKEQTKKNREEGVEADLERVKDMEEELRKREKEYAASITGMEAVVEALRDELRLNIEKVENLEGQLEALREAEGRVKDLEEELASAPRHDATTELEREELRKLLAYLDDLLSKLPEKEIENFSKTEYFEIYGRILDRLGI